MEWLEFGVSTAELHQELAAKLSKGSHPDRKAPTEKPGARNRKDFAALLKAAVQTNPWGHT